MHSDVKAPCYCGNQKTFAHCCAQYLNKNSIAPNAEALMRSRYTSYVLECEDYLLATWHTTTRPASLALNTEPKTKWLGLEVIRHEVNAQNASRAIVEFIARYKVNGRAHRLHEVSHFVREDGVWFYVDGITKP